MPADDGPLDDVDRAILYHLQSDARNTTNAEISDEVGVSATTVSQRIADLEDRGIVETHQSVVDYEAAGFPHRMLLVCTVDPAEREDADRLLDHHGVIAVRELIAGDRNLRVEVVARTRESLVDTVAAIEADGIEVVDTEMIKSVSTQAFDHFRPDGGPDG